jgi:hypothetical protein
MDIYYICGALRICSSPRPYIPQNQRGQCPTTVVTAQLLLQPVGFVLDFGPHIKKAYIFRWDRILESHAERRVIQAILIDIS